MQRCAQLGTVTAMTARCPVPVAAPGSSEQALTLQDLYRYTFHLDSIIFHFIQVKKQETTSFKMKT